MFPSAWANSGLLPGSRRSRFCSPLSAVLWRTAALAAFAAYFIGSLNLFTFFAKITPVPLVVITLATIALVFAGAVLVARFAVRRLPAWGAALAFPAAWTAYEFLSSPGSPHGTSLSLAYSQTSVAPPGITLVSVIQQQRCVLTPVVWRMISAGFYSESSY